MSASCLWDEMLDEFRALGGAAENVCLREGRFGRGLFPIDPSRPIKLHIPESLLVDPKYAQCEGNVFRVSDRATIGARERRFLENYEQNFSWGVSHQETADLLRMMHEAPPELREALSGSPWLAGPSPEAIQERFLAARTIAYQGKTVIMPIVELANHGHATIYEKHNGVGLSGKFDGEILVRYRHCDPLLMFGQWGFASPEAFALSTPLNVETKSGNLAIGLVEHIGFVPGRNPFFPDVAADGRTTTLSFLMLGHKNYPRLPRGIFYRIMREAGLPNPEELFDWIQHLNRTALYRMIAAAEGAVPALGKRVRDVVRYQLEAMSHSYGAREV